MSEKTEPPTAKKLREARRKGQVAHSKDFTQTLLILAIFGDLIAHGGAIADGLAELVLLPAGLPDLPFEQAAGILAAAAWRKAMQLVLPILGLVIGVSLLAEMMQVGVLLAFEALEPSAKKLDIAANLKNMVSAKNWIEFAKSLLKVSVLGAVIALLLRQQLGMLLTLPRGGIGAVGLALASLLQALFVQVAAVYVVIAGFDFLYQRWHHRKQLMMSKDEVMREYKEMEGDPHIKHKRRHLHQELLASGAEACARKASVLVTNPTHLAIALRYEDAASTPLPVVLAKGEGALAARMVKAAREAGVPVLQNIPLAWALMTQAEVDRYIPSDLAGPVAEVLRAVQELNRGHP